MEKKLHPHDPQSVLRLLEGHLPHSLTVYSSILAGPIPSPPAGADPQVEPWRWIWTTFPPSSPLLTSAGDRKRPSEQISEKKDSIDQHREQDLFVVIVQLAGVMKKQTRMYCSAERYLATALEGLNTTESGRGMGSLDRIRSQGQSLVNGTIARYSQISRTAEKLGAVHEVWYPGVCELLGKERRKEMYDIWIGPECGPSSSMSHIGAEGNGRTPEHRRKDIQGYIVGRAKVDDCQIIRDTREVKEEIAYYHDRLDHTTVIRYRPSDHPAEDRADPVAWILTHAAGDQGALFVLPSHRRKGLAKLVVASRLEAERSSGRHLRGYVWVERGNEASEHLWEGMGWSRGWGAQWVVLGQPST